MGIKKTYNEIKGDMMRYFVVDAFSDKAFKGNPAGVCVVDDPIDDEIMQKIAFENNLAETAFFTSKNGYYDLRWFTPKIEIDLCGHATLASAYIIMNYVCPGITEVQFKTKSGMLFVKREGSLYKMDFPRRKPMPCEIPLGLQEALGVKIKETYLSRDLLILVENEPDVMALNPDIEKLKLIKEPFAFIVTLKSDKFDFVSRFFAPNAGINEDPVTGSSHSTLIPFWSERLKKDEMVSAQLSQRGGILYCKDKGDRVEIGGKAVCYLTGNIQV